MLVERPKGLGTVPLIVEHHGNKEGTERTDGWKEEAERDSVKTANGQRLKEK